MNATARDDIRPPRDALALALRVAAAVIAAVFKGRNLDAALAARDMGRAHPGAVRDLAYGALRQYGRGDFLLARLLRTPLADPQVRALLLAAFYRLEARPEDAHTTVDQAVTAAATLADGRYKGLVNGVLRNVLRRQAELNAAVAADEVAHYRYPAWWIARVRADFPADWQRVLDAGNGHPPMTLRINRRRLDAAAYALRLDAVGIAARILDDAAVLLERPVPVDKLPGFAEGLVSVQDWGAQRAAALLDARPRQRVLDACAAPGGKTAHLLECADLALTALDADAERARRIDDNLARLNLSARVVAADARDVDAWWDGRPFDRILADVPCSASGVVRRHPDIRWLRREADIVGFARLQREIIDAVWRTLAPGGRMLYATCSLFREENAEQMAAFAARHPDAQRLPAGSGEELQLTPQADHDGFYYAVLQKRP